jgi:Ion channel
MGIPSRAHRIRTIVVFVNLGAVSLLGLVSPDLLDEGKAWLREFSKKDPIDALLWTVLVSAHLFYRAEHGSNPKIKTLNDALVFVTTNLSVGYCDIYAMTEPGKQVASVLMTIGPAMAARALDPTQAETDAKDDEEREHREKLERTLQDIANLLRAQTSSAVAQPASATAG